MDNPQEKATIGAEGERSPLAGLGLSLSDREKKNLLTFLSIGIILVEFAVTIAAVCYGIINSQKLPDGTTQFRFPWIPYSVALILAPVAIMLIVNIISMGFGRFFKGEPAMFIGRVGFGAAGKARDHVDDARDFFHIRFHAPKAATSQGGHLGRRLRACHGSFRPVVGLVWRCRQAGGRKQKKQHQQQGRLGPCRRQFEGGGEEHDDLLSVSR